MDTGNAKEIPTTGAPENPARGLAVVGRRLALALVDGLRLRPGDVVLEFGAEGGVLTEVIQERLLRGGGEVGYLGIERDGAAGVRSRHLHPGLCFAVGDCTSLGRVVAAAGIESAAAVICGVPLMSLARGDVDALLATVGRLLRPGGVFRTFAPVASLGKVRSWSLRERMHAVFPAFAVHGPVLRSVPPLLVYEGRNPG